MKNLIPTSNLLFLRKKKPTIVLFITLLSVACYGQSLIPGDIAFVQYTEDPNSYAFVALTDIPPNEQISFTDKGLTTSGQLQGFGESITVWQAPSTGLPKGTVVTFTNSSAANPIPSIGSATGNGLSLNSDGDNILAFQGSSSSPSFIAAISMNGPFGDGEDGDNIVSGADFNETEQPPNLISNNTSIAIIPEVRFAAYDGSTTVGDRATLLAAINNPDNWIRDNSNPVPFTATFTLPDPFITTWDVEQNDIITIPLQSGTYNFDFTWTLLSNPAVQISGTHTNADGAFTTNFVTAGVYQLEIDGQFPHLKGYPVDKLLDVIQWGDIVWGSLNAMFENWLGTSFSATDTPDLSLVTNMSSTFQGATNFNDELDDWDVSNVTRMDRTFRFATSFNQDIGDWNVGEVTNMGLMFERADSFNQEINTWDVSNVTSMKLMFSRTASFNQDIGAWNVSKVTDMESMFQAAKSFNQDISNWDVSSVTNMRQMFDSADSFNQPIGKWDVSNNLSFREMFRQNDAFNQSLGGWQFNPNANFLSVFGGADGMDCQAWSSTILGWNFSNPELENIPFGGPNNVEYDTIANRARNELLTRGWSISGTLFLGDCEAVHEFTCKDTVLIENDTLFGNLIINAAQLIILDSIVIDTIGATSTTATAGESIVFKPGFHAVAGSNFTAKIGATPCGGDNNEEIVNEVVQSRSEEEPKQEPVVATEAESSEVLSLLSLQLAPNPTSGQLQLKLESQMSGQAMLQVINLNGQLVYRSQIEVSQGTTLNELDVTHLPAGTYFLLVQNSKQVAQAKFVKL